MSQYIIRPPLDQPESFCQKQACLTLQQKRLHSIFQTPMVKMSYNDYLIKQNDKIISVNLPDNSKHQQYEQIFKDRETYEKQIKEFVHQEETKGGGYYFYSWVSNDQYLCTLPAGGIPLLACYVFAFEYEKAVELVEKWDKTIVTETLSIVLKGFHNIVKIVHNDPELRKTFFNKKMNIKQTLANLIPEFTHPKLLLIQNSQSLDGILDSCSTFEEKKNCILANLSYLKKFLSCFPNIEIDEYYKLIFAFMSNTEDQLESKNMYNLLLKARQLNLLDRLNFAQKLVPLKQRRQFLAEFSLEVLNLTNLSNLLFFSALKEEVGMERIIGNYLDQYGDLESVASVCLEYGTPKLMDFVDLYQEILVLSCEQKKAQNLQQQQYKKLGDFCLKKQRNPEPISKLFLNHINFQQQKIQPISNISDNFIKICYVCYRKNEFTQDLFVECGRCKHGGHLNHLLKWYEESNNVCPKTDCPCYCV